MPLTMDPSTASNVGIEWRRSSADRSSAMATSYAPPPFEIVATTSAAHSA